MQPASPAGDEPATLQSRLEVADDGGPDGAAAVRAVADPTMTDPVSLLRHLDVSGHFHRDSRFGRLFHRGMVSLRENVPTDSLHISVDGNRLAAHVDGVSPLAADAQGPSRYSARRAVVHNLAGMAQDLVGLLRGRQGDHRCELNCEWVSGEVDSAPKQADLLEPRASAWSVQLEARVAGQLDEARLRAALGNALGQIPERDPLHVVDCPDDDSLDAARARLQSMPVAPTEYPPLHVYLARHPAGDVLMLNLNHAAADGFGALQVLRCIARGYAGDAEPDAALDFLALRDLPVRPASPPASVPLRFYRGTIEWLRDMLARPARLAGDQPGEHPGYGFHLLALSADETRRVVDASRPGTSSNVLMAALHLTIGDWNVQHNAPGRWIGVLAPANLRPTEWPEETIGNVSVTVRVSTSPRDRADAASALNAIAAQAARDENTRTGIALIAGLQRARLLALWAKQSVVVLQPITGNHLADAAMLCDLGSMDETPSFGPDVGEATELWFSTPARSPLSLCLGALTVGGRLHLTFRYPHRLFGSDAARRFADSYLDHLRSVAGSRCGPHAG